ncbi:hypothetical protein BOTBODRAFT_502234 [Botryobasidium botryosum FD-172 SS1]|uniref:Uncharacterized protein n=1 Tax=Botryobasidium botryosum (strain FD-172 SS1) TaxID=930990 RepID=A0A067ME12_BOTB1|nr:hypothetical protein BOTBODRAFT_502234 [Botryobasidium botryosum FD-172 SS1]
MSVYYNSLTPSQSSSYQDLSPGGGLPGGWPGNNGSLPRSPAYSRVPSTSSVDSSTQLRSNGNGLPTSFPEPATHPLSRENFEKPPRKMVVFHIILCCATGPAMYYTMRYAKGLSIDHIRAVVGALTGLLGLLLGFTLVSIGERSFEAATWATIVQESNRGGLSIKEFDDIATRGGPIAALHLLSKRLRGVRARTKSRYPWNVSIFVFLLLALLSACMSFLLARTVTITSYVASQRSQYRSVAVVGDLSPRDIQLGTSLVNTAFTDPFAYGWIVSSFAYTTQMMPIQFQFGPDTIYFNEAFSQQLLPNGVGPGTFTQSEANMTTATPVTVANTTKKVTDDPGLGQLLRWPRWGIRTTCQSLPSPAVNIIPTSPAGYTYVFVPRSLVDSLYTALKKPVSPHNGVYWNLTGVMKGNDQPPAGLDLSTIVMAYAFADNGLAYSSQYWVDDDGGSGSGWAYVETTLVRVDKAYAPKGVFPVSAALNGSTIGYDVAICLEVVEPWVLEVYNATGGVPYTTGIIGRGNTVLDGKPMTGVTSGLNSSAPGFVYNAAYTVARKEFADPSPQRYAPGPILVDFTGGSGAYGYTQLSPSHLASVIGAWDSARALPYLVGSAQVLAHAYEDIVLSIGSVHLIFLGAILAGTLVIGLAAAMFVPRLPMGVPRRDFGVFSSISIAHRALQKLDESQRSNSPLELNEIKERIGHVEIQYGATGPRIGSNTY